jgi:hypothetical protein
LYSLLPTLFISLLQFSEGKPVANREDGIAVFNTSTTEADDNSPHVSPQQGQAQGQGQGQTIYC